MIKPNWSLGSKVWTFLRTLVDKSKVIVWIYQSRDHFQIKEEIWILVKVLIMIYKGTYLNQKYLKANIRKNLLDKWVDNWALAYLLRDWN